MSTIGLVYRKFYWCQILLPKAGDAYGVGDVIELIPMLLIVGTATLGCVVGILCLTLKKMKDVKYGLFVVCLSVVVVPAYVYVHSYVNPICGSKN